MQTLIIIAHRYDEAKHFAGANRLPPRSWKYLTRMEDLHGKHPIRFVVLPGYYLNDQVNWNMVFDYLGASGAVNVAEPVIEQQNKAQ